MVAPPRFAAAEEEALIECGAKTCRSMPAAFRVDLTQRLRVCVHTGAYGFW